MTLTALAILLLLVVACALAGPGRGLGGGTRCVSGRFPLSVRRLRRQWWPSVEDRPA